ncbi:MAG: DUF262 domain-containing protein [Flavobacteriales bacterium]|nr:DUF262 domain-containing protein [Flavobacteriales bacterium]MBK7247525.1 DUF262 domain-containing protein [Flavobacteriales bacterium]MBK9061236.1 DUF262 domain-containing protein [Flavobacteriales bacterium]QQS72815.1 MAG: DUF262 domain-containing protein [Flavobacteriales bacterium]HQV37532.1 DUF262 domain-containing protein [Flavobacteriales bacterium]
MALQDEILSKKREIITDGYPMSIGELVNLYKDDELDIHPEFQRLFRWKPLQRTRLIESILLGIPIPSIFVSQRKDGVWDVVDGLQRLSTIFEFIGILKDENGKVLPGSRLIRTEYLPSLEGKAWENTDDPANSLDAAMRIAFKREKIDVKIVKQESDDSIKYELFQRLNTLGSKLSDQEVRNCLLVMLDRPFHDWLKNLSEDEHFLSTISIAERLLKEKYNMELALRFVILSLIDPNEVKGVNDFSEFITEKMVSIVNDKKFDRVSMENKFTRTFTLLDASLGDSSFQRYNSDKQRFEGKFLVAAFEAVAIGLGKNISLWKDKDPESLVDKVKDIWSNPKFQSRYGAGVNVTSRVPAIIPLGETILRP